jgi:hypothetical protein
MKQYLIAFAMLLTLATTTQVAAQKHRHSAATTATVAQTQPMSPATADTVGIEAYSDTTGVADDSLSYNSQNMNYHVNVSTPVDNLLSSIDGDDIAGMFFVLCIVTIMFLLAPVLIIAAIFYFINKSRKDKLKLAQMAIQNGQPVPEPLIRETPISPNIAYRSGIKQVFLGVGLMVFLGFLLGKFGFGIGALVFFIGLGKLVIALIDKSSEKKTYTYTPRQTPPPPVNHDTETTSSNEIVE